MNEISIFWFHQLRDIIPNHFIEQPAPDAMIVTKCTPIKIEVIVRGYLVGSLWRDYRDGEREKCGVPLPDGLKQNDPLPEPIITPTTKAEHDEDLTVPQMIEKGLVSREHWKQIETAALQLFAKGQEIVAQRGLMLVDTKYEFGLDDGELTLIDEVHTPDSSRYWYPGEKKFFDKEYVREWVMEQGLEGSLPPLSEEMQNKIRQNYIGLYETITGRTFSTSEEDVPKRLVANLKKRQCLKE